MNKKRIIILTKIIIIQNHIIKMKNKMIENNLINHIIMTKIKEMVDLKNLKIEEKQSIRELICPNLNYMTEFNFI